MSKGSCSTIASYFITSKSLPTPLGRSRSALDVEFSGSRLAAMTVCYGVLASVRLYHVTMAHRSLPKPT